jgi:hypothetical protein
MGIAWRGPVPRDVTEYVDVFTEPLALYQHYQAVIRNHVATMANAAVSSYTNTP